MKIALDILKERLDRELSVLNSLKMLHYPPWESHGTEINDTQKRIELLKELIDKIEG